MHYSFTIVKIRISRASHDSAQNLNFSNLLSYANYKNKQLSQEVGEPISDRRHSATHLEEQLAVSVENATIAQLDNLVRIIVGKVLFFLLSDAIFNRHHVSRYERSFITDAIFIH